MTATRLDFRSAVTPPEASTAPWVENAECARQPDPELWFSDDYSEQQEAVRVCNLCPARTTCLTTAMANEAGRSPKSRFGISGGLIPRQRALLARKAS